MKILFTGASSFTGHWFAAELCRGGHEVVAVFQRAPGAYEGVRAERVRGLEGSCRRVFECSFGTPAFQQLIEGEPGWDVLCHHAADVTNYRSPDFDVPAALENNTRNLPRVLEALERGGCRRVVLTGSVFEGGEGAGSDGLRDFSPYGLSKALTARVFRYHAAVRGLSLGKFVIPNPFGPFEEPRFTAYLMKTWFAGERASVKTPDYVRDNVHVTLLAREYARFTADLGEEAGFRKINPSGYVETQGAFARRFAASIGGRLGLECELELRLQLEFDEPRVRINTDAIDRRTLGWDEEQAWDELAEYYREAYGSPGR